ncbi:MAG: TetR/AcrR family transcriptional regulator [Caldilineaceae bacterium]
MPRPKKTIDELQSTREKILDIALAILQENGPEAITSRAIAERMKVAHMFLFTYFKNQAELLAALRDRETAKWYARQEEISRRVATEAVPRLVEEMLELIANFPRENPKLFRLAWVIPEVTGASPKESRLRMYNTVGNLAKLLAIGMGKGDYVRRDPFLAAGVILGMVNLPSILFHSGKIVDTFVRDRMVAEMFSAAKIYLKNEEESGIQE